MCTLPSKLVSCVSAFSLGHSKRSFVQNKKRLFKRSVLFEELFLFQKRLKQNLGRRVDETTPMRRLQIGERAFRMKLRVWWGARTNVERNHMTDRKDGLFQKPSNGDLVSPFWGLRSLFFVCLRSQEVLDC